MAQVDAVCEFEVDRALVVIVVLLEVNARLDVAITLDAIEESTESDGGEADVETGDSNDVEVVDEGQGLVRTVAGVMTDRADVDVEFDHVGQPVVSEHGYVGEPYG